MTPQQRAKAAQRVPVIAANSELQERGLLEHARIARSISAALRERGTDELTDHQVRAAELVSGSRLLA